MPHPFPCLRWRSSATTVMFPFQLDDQVVFVLNKLRAAISAGLGDKLDDPPVEECQTLLYELMATTLPNHCAPRSAPPPPRHLCVTVPATIMKDYDCLYAPLAEPSGVAALVQLRQ